VLLGITGCDRVFDVTQVDDPRRQDADLPPDADLTRDTDDDGVADADDNCPGVSNAAQGDGDMDRIGDACDPDASEPNALVALTLFHAEADGWTPDPTAGWARQDGYILSPELGTATTGGTLRYDATQPLKRPTLQVGFSFIDFGVRTNTFNNQIELLLLDDDDDVHLNADCQAREDNQVDLRSNLLLHFDGNSTPQQTSIDELVTNRRYVFSYTRGVSSKCRLGADSASHADVAMEQLSAVRPAIKLDHVSVKIDYIAVYQLQ